ncbi:hypothetical protein ADIARSV_1042 [Arcticibacter svalbardensis MN12-7]|uniref:Lipoprotein n=1 Tax=Arcticibacter svalbardensis MN12-7 TaxID=1150600 RepID=R9H3I4_9SPHI|nr:hypothetical protein [Arcticibacter svalbardensis]EOR95729.1 hypothetical protein ADIARSV_1042 [Arcticibacter svalbardensis MN12-7]
MNKYLKLLASLIIPFVLLSSCGTSTQIVGSWQKSEIKTLNYQRVLVAALTNNINAQQKVEEELSMILSRPGVVVTKSIDAFPPNLNSKTSKDKEALLRKLRRFNSDIIVTNTVVDKKVSQNYSGGGYGPWGWGNRWGMGMYGGWGGGFYDNGFSSLDKDYYLETNVFNSKSGELIWSVQSRTHNPSSLNKFIEGYAKVIAQKMIEDGVIKQF